MTNNLKVGDKFLLPVEVFDIVGFPGGDVHNVRVCTIGDDYFKLYDEDVAALIPASTLTDLQAENAKLKTALTSIKDMLEQPNHRDVLPEMIYQIAVKALGGE